MADADKVRQQTRERQRRWREKIQSDPEAQRVRLEVFVSPDTAARLDRVLQATGWTRRQAIEEGILLLEKAHVR